MATNLLVWPYRKVVQEDNKLKCTTIEDKIQEYLSVVESLIIYLSTYDPIILSIIENFHKGWISFPNIGNVVGVSKLPP